MLTVSRTAHDDWSLRSPRRVSVAKSSCHLLRTKSVTGFV